MNTALYFQFFPVILGGYTVNGEEFIMGRPLHINAGRLWLGFIFYSISPAIALSARVWAPLQCKKLWR